MCDQVSNFLLLVFASDSCPTVLNGRPLPESITNMNPVLPKAAFCQSVSSEYQNGNQDKHELSQLNSLTSPQNPGDPLASSGNENDNDNLLDL